MFLEHKLLYSICMAAVVFFLIKKKLMVSVEFPKSKKYLLNWLIFKFNGCLFSFHSWNGHF